MSWRNAYLTYAAVMAALSVFTVVFTLCLLGKWLIEAL